MTDDLKELLRFKHNDTWPKKIGYGDLVNEDGPEAADRIEKLEAALRELSTDWDCCAVSKNMKLIARKALEGNDE